jgi:hypothetical protein
MSIWTPAPTGSAKEEAREVVDLARLLLALQTMDQNAHDRMRELKLFLFFLPFVWGLIWGLVWIIIRAGR